MVEPDQFGNVLQHFTGSKAHNVAMRESVVRRGLHVSEYGILDDATGETLRCATEEEVYAALGLAWIPPELREGRGELEAAAAAARAAGADRARGPPRRPALPHDRCRTASSTLEQMAQAARARGYEYLAITDHSASHGFGDHVTAGRARASRARPRARRAARRHQAADRDGDQHPHRRRRSTTTDAAARAARLGDRLASTPRSGWTSATMTDRMIAADRAPAGRRDRPPDRPQDRAAPAATRSTCRG